ncbi:TMV resistance protein N-like protein isoform X1 [Tanacetum coccineum]
MVIITEEASSSTIDYIYDVFLSFRGADTRNNFTNHLHTALVNANIKTFLDDNEIETGLYLKPELESAIRASRASIVVLSKNYASSTWCLNELVLILEQHMKFNHIVIPVFYHVEPTDVRKQQNSFGDAMVDHKQKMEAETNVDKKNEWAQKMEIWKNALAQVANLKGKEPKDRLETDFIEEIVTNIYHQLGILLRSTLPQDPQLIGIDYSINFLCSWLQDGSDHNAEKYTPVHDVSVYTSTIENALARKKVFIILDDIDSPDQLDVIHGNKGFHPGSKIIITTKDASLTERCALFRAQVQPKHTKHKLKSLHVSDSLKLLCLHAFKSEDLKEGYKAVSDNIVNYYEGHPLALKVLGRDFTETILRACNINTRSGITHLVDKCLLHIDWNNVLSMHSLVQEMGRDEVRQESPDKPWKHSRLWCHEESFKVLKQKKDKANLLGLSLDMQMLENEKLRESSELKTAAFSNMDSLMILLLDYVQINGPYENFPEELRWLRMCGFPLKSIPSELPMENLVALDMSRSNIEFFDISCSSHQPTEKMQKLTGSCSKAKRLLGSLKILDLSFSEHLRGVSGFCELRSLESLFLRNCSSLIEICESIDHCYELVFIDLSNCKELRKLPRTLAKLRKVKKLLLNGCNMGELAVLEAVPRDFKSSAVYFPSVGLYGSWISIHD